MRLRFPRDPGRLCCGAVARFDAAASFDPDGTIVAFRWNFADGSPQEAYGTPEALHVFEAPGNYPVTLEVADDAGATHRAVHRVRVSAEAPDPCHDDCPLGQLCLDGLCWNEGAGDACADDADCLDPTERCYGGACTEPECETDADCGGRAACRGGLCQHAGAPEDGGGG